jgi:hypothetical protein
VELVNDHDIEVIGCQVKEVGGIEALDRREDILDVVRERNGMTSSGIDTEFERIVRREWSGCHAAGNPDRRRRCAAVITAGFRRLIELGRVFAAAPSALSD